MLAAMVEALVGATLVLAGVTKVFRPQRFSRTVAGYELIGWRLSLLVGHTLPWLEIAVGCALLTGLFRPWPAATAALLFTAFAAALAINRLRGRTHLACGCFRDEAPRPLTWLVVARPAALAVLTLAAGGAVALDPTRAGAPLEERFLIVALGVLSAIAAFVIGDVRTVIDASTASAAGPARSPSPNLLEHTKDAW